MNTQTRRQKVEQREQAILNTARAVFKQHGYEGARMADIARRAGIAEGTIYIYYKTKVDLMNAIVAAFWNDLTHGAESAARSRENIYDSLRALAEFHVSALIERFDIIELTQTIRSARPDEFRSRKDMKAYVAVFDSLFRRGIDRGTFRNDTPLWVARDMFYGTLEYSARTILLHKERGSTAVVQNLVDAFRTRFGTEHAVDAGVNPSAAVLMRRLERAIKRLETMAAK
jgi:TetR/AcrR family fatty acid metabolism transcriptional regulator